MLVDDHDLFRRGLAEVLEEEPGVEVVAQARDGLEATQKASDIECDVVFMDLNLPGQSGIETTAYLTQRWPDMKVLVLTVSEDPEDLMRALGVGALGYVLKTARPREIVEALRNVHEGWVIVSPSMAPRFLADLSQTAESTQAVVPDESTGQLTLREREVLEQVSLGLSNAEIAATFTVSENTVKTHIKNILGKLHTKNRSEAVAYATRLGFLRNDPDSGIGRQR